MIAKSEREEEKVGERRKILALMLRLARRMFVRHQFDSTIALTSETWFSERKARG
jgi:hypothetical protein